MIRTRDIVDALGGRLSIGVDARPDGATVVLERPVLRGRPRAVLDVFGGELLWAYIMAARLAGDGGLADECSDGACTTRLRLTREPRPAIVLIQAGLERPFEIPATFWDRLYAELGLALAHLRALDRRAGNRTEPAA